MLEVIEVLNWRTIYRRITETWSQYLIRKTLEKRKSKPGRYVSEYFDLLARPQRIDVWQRYGPSVCKCETRDDPYFPWYLFYNYEFCTGHKHTLIMKRHTESQIIVYDYSGLLSDLREYYGISVFFEFDRTVNVGQETKYLYMINIRTDNAYSHGDKSYWYMIDVPDPTRRNIQVPTNRTFKCTICTERYCNCVLDRCGHVFCIECADKFNHKCPNCRAEFETTVMFFDGEREDA